MTGERRGLVVHLLRKDARRLRWELTLFVVTQCAGAAILVFPAPISSNQWWWFLAIQALLTAFIAVQAIQLDSFVDSRAFWRTRPIARGALLLSKSLFAAAALGLFPTVVAGFVGRATGLAWDDVMLAMVATLFAQALLVVPVFAIGSLTASLRTFVLGAVLGVGGTAFLGVAMSRALASGTDWVSAPFSLFVSRRVASGVVLILAAAVVVGIHALTLKRRWAVAMACAGVAAYLASGFLWPWDFIAPNVIAADAKSAELHAIQLHLDLDRVRIESGFTQEGRDDSVKQLLVGLTWSDVPDPMVLEPIGVRATFRDRLGSEWRFEESPIRLRRSFPLGTPATESQRRKALTRALGRLQWLNDDRASDHGEIVPVVQLSAGDFREIRGRSGTLTVFLDVEIARFEAAAGVPLQSGARLIAPGQSITIHRVGVVGHPAARTVLGDVRETRISRAIIRWSRIGGWTVVRNGPRAEALFAHLGLSRPLPMNAIEPWPFYFQVGPGSLRTIVADAPQVDQAWLNDAEIVSIRPVHLGTLTLTTRVDDFVIEESP